VGAPSTTPARLNIKNIAVVIPILFMINSLTLKVRGPQFSDEPTPVSMWSGYIAMVREVGRRKIPENVPSELLDSS
jgi:hypothetical protein